jgi:hypothetical protein
MFRTRGVRAARKGDTTPNNRTCLAALALNGTRTVPTTTADLWYRFVAPATGVVNLQAATENASSVLLDAGIGFDCDNTDAYGLPLDAAEWNSIVDTPAEFLIEAGQILYVKVYGTDVAPYSTLTLTFRVPILNEAGTPFRNDAGQIFTQAA